MLLSSCSSDQQVTSDRPPPLYANPFYVELNVDEGYAVHPYYGDTIMAVVNSLGKTLVTGTKVEIKGKVIDPDEWYPPYVVPAKQPEVVRAYSNKNRMSESHKVDLINKDALKSSGWRKDSASIFINAMRDTVLTGVPFTAKGIQVPSKQQRPVKAMLPDASEKAIRNITYLDVDQGLPASIIEALAVDYAGNIWIGAFNTGLCKYDGNTFVSYTTNEGLSNNSVKAIFPDSDGRIWIGTLAGLNVFDGESFTQFTEEEGLTDNHITAIVQDSKDNIWIGTYSGGVTRFDGQTFTHFTTNEGLSNNSVSDILEDSKGDYWFATWGGGATRFDGQTFTHFTQEDSLHNNYLLSLEEDNQGNIWFCSPDGISIYNGASFAYITEKEGLSSSHIMKSMKDSKGNLWFATSGGGVNKFDGTSFTYYSEKEGLISRFPHVFAEDRKGNILVGTNGRGIGILKNTDFTHFREEEGLKTRVVFSFEEDVHGNIWFGTRGGGINKYDGQSFTYYTFEEGLNNNYVLAVTEDSQGNIWSGTYGNGISTFDGKTFAWANSSFQGLCDYTIRRILEDSKGNIWLGSQRGGINIYNGAYFILYSEEEGLGSNTIFALFEDSRGNIWIGTGGAGVSKYDGDSYIHYTKREGLIHNTVDCIMEDRKGNIWMGTNNGISVFDGKGFLNITEDQGLTDNTIKTMCEDPGGNVWISTMSGLNCIVLEQGGMPDPISRMADSSLMILTYYKSDGLQGVNFYHDMLLDSKNRMWWGSSDNLTMLDLNSFKIPLDPPMVKLSWIEIKGQFIDFNQGLDELKTKLTSNGHVPFCNYPENLAVPFKNNHLTFYFSANECINPHKILYSYKIDGVDEDWSPPSREAKADYRSLPYGRHTFKVCAIGETLEWSEPFEYTFTITPPWYHTWIARVSYVLLALMLVYGFVRWRTANLKRRHDELKREVNKATKEILEQKDKVEAQKDEIEAQRDELQKQRDTVISQKQEITDSINYAQRIQSAVLPDLKQLKNLIPESFVLYKPRDIVSGDFYWIKEVKNYVIIAVADCTGHGVPGAFMSMLGISLLNEQVGRSRFDKPGEILDRLRKKVKHTLAQEGRLKEQKDGMDMVLIMINKDTKELQFAGAFNPLYLIRHKQKTDDGKLQDYASLEINDHQLFEIKGDRQPISIHELEEDFTTKEIQLLEGDTIYMFSDGFADQIGGPKGKKFLVRNLKRTLLSMQSLPMNEQKQSLEGILEEWKAGYEQVDDIILMGIKIQ